MKNRFKQNRTDHTKFYKKINFLLFLLFFGMLAGYFAWFENPGLNKAFKMGSRLIMTICIYFVFKSIIKRGAVASFTWENLMAPLLYGAFLGLGLASFAWSYEPEYSALQWFMDVESLVYAYYFIGSFIMLNHFFPDNPIKLYKVVGHASFGLILIFVIGYFVDPGTFMRMSHGGEEFRLGGFIMNPNELGMLAAVGVTCYMFVLYGKKGRIFTIIKILILLYAVVLTGSRSTTIGCLIVAFFHIKQSSNAKLKAIMYIGAALVIPVAVDVMIVKSEGNGGAEEVLSFTGRLPFWTALITEGLPHEPLLGFGFQRIWYDLYFSGEHIHTYSASMAHNTFVQVLMNLGFVGFTIMLFQMIFTFKAFITSKSKETRLMSIGIIIPLLINSFTEFGIFGETNYSILFYQVLILYVSMKIQPRLTLKEKLYLKRQRPDLSVA